MPFDAFPPPVPPCRRRLRPLSRPTSGSPRAPRRGWCATPASAPAARHCPTSASLPSIRPSTWWRWPTWTCAALDEVLTTLPEGPRLPGLARAAEEGGRPPRFGERLDSRSHARAAGDRGACGRASTSTCRSRWPTRCARCACSPSTRARRGVISQMGIQVSSSKAQRYGEWLVQSGIVGKIREVHTFSNKSWGDDKPLGEGVDQVPPTLDWDQWLGVAETRPFKRNVYHPGEWRRRDRVRHRHAGRHGLPHLQPAVPRAEADGAIEGHLARAHAVGAESWAVARQGAPGLPGHGVHGGPDGGRVVVRRRGDAARRPRAQVGTRMPDQGSIVVGTDGTARPAAQGAEAFALPDAKMATIQKPSSAPARSLRRVPRRGAGRARDAVLGRLRLQRALSPSRC